MSQRQGKELTRLPPALCRRLFRTSAGAQTVVATVPARREARMWVGVLSWRCSRGVERRWDLVVA